MNLDTLAFVALILAGGPFVLFCLNLAVYRVPSAAQPGKKSALSVLIPARNEEANIAETLRSVLSSKEAEFELVVLDDHSTDRTAEIVRAYAEQDHRVRLENAPPLPPGWCGKQHACYILAGLARHPLLVFIDADVRLSSDALARISQFMEDHPAALISGVPRQHTGTFSEKLLIPLIHTILLGFLPMHAMRRTRWPAMSGGCGQLFIARKGAYDQCGGHSRLKNSLHDGIKLPRVFRQAGYETDLFDATSIASCRMYQSNTETWRGLAKNATEALAAPATILPMTLLLAGGQILPFVLATKARTLSTSALWCIMIAIFCAWTPRFVAVFKFRQSLLAAILHPLGILTLLMIQWQAFLRLLSGKPSHWKGRSYPGSARMRPAQAT